MHRDLREQNRLSWNAVVPAHESHRGDQVRFFHADGSTLFPEELALLGDLPGRRVAHLLCNTGQDTLSLARLGAEVVGVDISDVAITAARALATATGFAASFECADIYDWLQAAAAAGRRFEIVYMGYGTICWLPDLAAWAAGVAAILASGGRLVLVDFHPVGNMFDAEWRRVYPYDAAGRILTLSGVGDYVGASQGGLSPAGFTEGISDFHNPYPCHLFTWGLGEIITALIGAGLYLTALHEYPYLNGERKFSRMREVPGRRLLPPDDVPPLPLLFGLAAVQP